MAGLPPLARVLRYSVGRTDLGLVGTSWMAVVRICVGVPVACGSLDDDAATAMLRIEAVHGAISLLRRAEPQPPGTMRCAGSPTRNGPWRRVGTSVRLLLDAGAHA
jgi:hypothetical protein